jgi:subtilisin-like proprotein convertase family protein
MGSPFAIRRWFGLLTLALGLSAGWAQTESQSVQVHEGTQPREFEIATDEIAVRPKKGPARLDKITGETAPEGIKRKARQLETTSGDETELVLYEKGRPRNEWSRRVLTRQVLVRLAPGTDENALARRVNATVAERPEYAPGHYIFLVKGSGEALAVAETLRTTAGVKSAEPLLRKKQKKRFTPNDPFFSYSAANAGYQWHLKNTGALGGTAGIDVNVSSVWDTYKGTGVRIAIVDDGLQKTHPDLSANVDPLATEHHNWNGSPGTVDDPSPNTADDYHGTSCAGVAAARGNNGVGVSGAAPEATLVGLRLIAAAESDQDEADAINWLINTSGSNPVIPIKSNSWGPDDSSLVMEGPGTLASAALVNATTAGRGGKGSIFLWAAGNGLEYGDNSNNDGYANSIYVVAVGALDDHGEQTFYGEPGANIAISAPTGSSPRQDISTTDLVGNNGYNISTTSGDYSARDYTNSFNGTSSACPLAAGVCALVLQSNPNLGWRDLKEILMRSATKNDPTDSDWSTNAAGFHFNHKFGAGLINAQAAVTLASTWTNLGAMTSVTSAQTGLSVAIPDNNVTGITRSFNLSGSANLRVEHVTVNVTINHTARGDLAVTLTSPSGTVSRLAEVHDDTANNYSNWTFSTVHHWGENSQGVWTVKITDTVAQDSGTLTSITLKTWGVTAPAGNHAPTITAAQISPAPTAFSDQTLTLGSITANDPESNPISYSYQWQASSDGTTFSNLGAATTATLPAAAENSGLAIRCVLTPTDGSYLGTPFPTAAVTVLRRPTVLAKVGQAYSLDCDLPVADAPSPFTKSAIINEFSQGPDTVAATDTKEWVEILVLKTTDMRGYKFTDGSNTLTMTTNSLWSNVPAGTLIVFYNGADRDSLIPSDDTNASDGLVVIGSNNATYVTGTWPSFSDTSAENIALKNGSDTLIDGVSFNNGATYSPALAVVALSKSAHFISNTEANADLSAQWTIVSSAAGFATPGVGNGGTNTTFVSDLRNGAFSNVATYRFGTGNELVPGLSLNTTTGLLSGTLGGSGGLYHVVIERTNGTRTVAQSFDLLVGSSSDVYTVPAGKTWTLLANTTLSGTLLNSGTLALNGFSFGVNQSFNSWTAAYGATGGATGDPDADTLTNLLEYVVGGLPNVNNTTFQPILTLQGPDLIFTYRRDTSATGVTVTVQQNSSLTNAAGWTAVSDSLVSTTGTIQTRQATVPAGTAPKFLRLQVTLP